MEMDKMCGFRVFDVHNSSVVHDWGRGRLDTASSMLWATAVQPNSGYVQALLELKCRRAYA